MQQLHSVRMAELVGRKTPAHARLKRALVQLQPGGARKPRNTRAVGPAITQNNGVRPALEVVDDVT